MINQLRKIISDYFGFNRTETNGLILLLFLVFILIFIPYLFRIYYISDKPDISGDQELLDSLVAHMQRYAVFEETELSEDLKKDSLFNFNPNTSSVEVFKLLGLEEHIANRIVKYRLAGGSFKTRNDFQKIFGLYGIMKLRSFSGE